MDPDPDPDPAVFVNELQDGNKKVFLLITFEDTFTEDHFSKKKKS
jgi:hypothetical protein